MKKAHCHHISAICGPPEVAGVVASGRIVALSWLHRGNVFKLIAQVVFGIIKNSFCCRVLANNDDGTIFDKINVLMEVLGIKSARRSFLGHSVFSRSWT